MHYILLILKALLFIILVMFSFYLYKYLNESKAVINTTTKFFKFTESSFRKRTLEEQQKILEEGNREEKGFIFNLDLLIKRSGIRDRLPFINTESYIAITLILVLVQFIAISMMINGILAFLISTLTLVGSYALLYILSGIAYEKIEKTILPFINIMENYSSTDDDIVSIINKTYPYIAEPLSNYLEDFCNEVRTTGDLTKSFRNLELKIENQKLKEIIKNLEICSRYEANYGEIIQDTRDSLLSYMKQREKRKVTIRNGRIEIVSSIAIMVILITLITGFIPNLSVMLLTNPIGNGILLYCILILGYCLFTIFAFDKR